MIDLFLTILRYVQSNIKSSEKKRILPCNESYKKIKIIPNYTSRKYENRFFFLLKCIRIITGSKISYTEKLNHNNRIEKKKKNNASRLHFCLTSYLVSIVSKWVVKFVCFFKFMCYLFGKVCDMTKLLMTAEILRSLYLAINRKKELTPRRCIGNNDNEH